MSLIIYFSVYVSCCIAFYPGKRLVKYINYSNVRSNCKQDWGHFLHFNSNIIYFTIKTMK